MRRLTFGLLFILLIPSCFAGGVGEEELGSDDLPLVWSFVLPDASPELVQAVRASLVPVELAAGYSIRLLVLERYSDMLDRLEDGTVHVATMPALTYLVAAEQGVVTPGMEAANDEIPDDVEIIAGPKTDLGASFESATFARCDRASPTNWLIPRIVLAAAGTGLTSGPTILEVTSRMEALAAVAEGRADFTAIPAGSDLSTFTAARGETVLRRVLSIDAPDGGGVHFRADVPREIRSSIVEALTDPDEAEPGTGVEPFYGLFGWTRFVAVDDDAYDRFRSMLAGVGVSATDLTEPNSSPDRPEG